MVRRVVVSSTGLRILSSYWLVIKPDKVETAAWSIFVKSNRHHDKRTYVPGCGTGLQVFIS